MSDAKELVAVPPKAGGAIQALVPSDMKELKYMAGLVISGGIAPASYDNDPKKIALGMMKAMEVGLPPITGLSWIAIINNRPVIWGDGAIALVQSKGLITKMEVVEVGATPEEAAETHGFSDDYGYEVRIWRKDQDSPYLGRFTVGDAKRAKLWMNTKKQPWMLYPRRMLRNRAAAFAIRDGFADALSGLHIREEIEDLPAPPPEKQDTTWLEDEPPAPVETVEEVEALPPPEEPGGSFVPDVAPEDEDPEAHPFYKVMAPEIAAAASKADLDAIWARNADNFPAAGAAVTVALERLRDEKLASLNPPVAAE